MKGTAGPGHRSQIAIGIIGSRKIVDQIKSLMMSFPSFAPLYRVFEKEEEALRLAEQISGEAEVLLLSGPLSHRLVKEGLRPGIPVHHLPITDAGLFKALVSSMGNGKLSGGVSIDTLTEVMVERTLKDFTIPQTRTVVYNGPIYAFKNHLVEFHQTQYASGACSVAFTGVSSVADELAKRGIPNELLLPSDQDIIVSLERSLLSTETRRSKEAQIVVGMIHVDDFGKLAEKQPSEHEVQKLKLDIHRILLDYVESLDGYLTHLGGEEYLFFTTRGMFERETGGYKNIPLAKELHKMYGISLSIGMGFGLSANEAGTNARIAMRKAKEGGGNVCFIVREDKTLIGPLEMAEPVRSVLSLTDAGLIKQAEDAGMTSGYLSKLLLQMARFGKQDYMVHELASVLDITVRSTHRLLQTWIDQGLVEIAGMVKVPRGRPRQVFRFSFLNRT